MLSKEQREFLLPKAFNAALRAGAAILGVYNEGTEYEVKLKDDNTPLIEADRLAHNTIREYLAKTHVPLMSEEGREMIYEERRAWDLYWLVDPLDGTKEFLKGNGEFTVNIAMMHNNVSDFSVVYVPYIKKIYFGCRGLGAFVKENVAPDAAAEFTSEEIFNNAKQLPLAENPHDPIRVAISRSHNTEETYRYIDILKMRFPTAQVVMHGSSYKFCLLAEGAMECYIRTTNTYEWDTAAGELILELAGGRTTSLPNFEQLEYNQISLLNPYFFSRSKTMPKIDFEKEMNALREFVKSREKSKEKSKEKVMTH